MFDKALSGAALAALMPFAFARQVVVQKVALRYSGRLSQGFHLVGKLKKLSTNSGPSRRHAMGGAGSAPGSSPSFTSWMPS